MTGTHLEPEDYHKKLNAEGVVVIDVRNRYETAIGRFAPTGAELIDPKMRKSTEFPVWLDKEETREKLKGKQVLMYCTGGVRCERASSLLRQKMETEPEYANLGIKGVYQLQGGIDKYFKKFPEGGCWEGKNYTFDKRFAHAPPALEAGAVANASGTANSDKEKVLTPLSKCEACAKPWDMYRGKRRCPTCGVPSLICRDCFEADRNGTAKLGREVRCELCVEEGVTSKREVKERIEGEQREYEKKLRSKNGTGEKMKRDGKKGRKGNGAAGDGAPAPNSDGITRIYVGNLCVKDTDESTLSTAFPGATLVLWFTDRTTGIFKGSCFVEMDGPDSAAAAVGRSGMKIVGRSVKVKFSPPDSKDMWPSPGAIRL